MTQLTMTHAHNVYPFLLHPTQMRFPIGGECVTCHGCQQRNQPRSQGLLRFQVSRPWERGCSGILEILARSLANVHCPLAD